MRHRQYNSREARAKWAQLLQKASETKERITITRHGREMVAIVPIEDLQLLEELEDHFDALAAEKARVEAKERGTISWEEMEQELDELDARESLQD